MKYGYLSYISLVFICLATASRETVKVTLHYESLCPYSLEFINKQLYPAYKKLGDVIKLDLIPFGNAWVKNHRSKRDIICQHGKKECYGNKIHACAIHNNTQDVWMHFIGCSMATSHPHDKKLAEKCADRHNLSWNKLRGCADGEHAFYLLHTYSQVVENDRIESVPSILFNNVFNETLDGHAREDFVAVVCNLLTEKPDVCFK